MKKFEMNLLNSEEMHNIIGGGKDTTCSKTGDTIFCQSIINIKLCKSFEANCTGNFSSSCNSSKVTISGCTTFSIGSAAPTTNGDSIGFLAPQEFSTAQESFIADVSPIVSFY
jgi:hypothetical protein